MNANSGMVGARVGVMVVDGRAVNDNDLVKNLSLSPGGLPAQPGQYVNDNTYDMITRNDAAMTAVNGSTEMHHASHDMVLGCAPSRIAGTL